jgi:hypothetical protein
MQGTETQSRYTQALGYTGQVFQVMQVERRDDGHDVDIQALPQERFDPLHGKVEGSRSPQSVVYGCARAIQANTDRVEHVQPSQTSGYMVINKRCVGVEPYAHAPAIQLLQQSEDVGPTQGLTTRYSHLEHLQLR